MVGFQSPFGDGEDPFDARDEFVPAHLPDPGPFLDGHDVLAGDDHVAFHDRTREIFEAAGVYDVTFGYNLARLNADTRHPDAGYRYAEQCPEVVRAEFTPTTAFCPQSRALTVGSFRAWNRSDGHSYDLIRVRVHPTHHRADAINDELAALEAEFRETGAVDGAASGEDALGTADPQSRS